MWYTRAIFVAEAYKIGYKCCNSRKLVCGMRFCRTRSVWLVLLLAITLFMTQPHLFVCFSCVMFVTPYHTLRAVRTNIGKFPSCQAAGLGVKEVELEIRPTEAMVGCTGVAGPAQDLWYQPPGRRIFLKKGRTRDIADILTYIWTSLKMAWILILLNKCPLHIHDISLVYVKISRDVQSSSRHKSRCQRRSYIR